MKIVCVSFLCVLFSISAFTQSRIGGAIGLHESYLGFDAPTNQSIAFGANVIYDFRKYKEWKVVLHTGYYGFKGEIGPDFTNFSNDLKVKGILKQDYLIPSTSIQWEPTLKYNLFFSFSYGLGIGFLFNEFANLDILDNTNEYSINTKMDEWSSGVQTLSLFYPSSFIFGYIVNKDHIISFEIKGTLNDATYPIYIRPTSYVFALNYSYFLRRWEDY